MSLGNRAAPEGSETALCCSGIDSHFVPCEMLSTITMFDFWSPRKHCLHWNDLKDIMWMSPSLNPRSLAHPKSGQPLAKPFAQPFAYLLIVLQTCFCASLLRSWVALQMRFAYSHHWNYCRLWKCRICLKLCSAPALVKVSHDFRLIGQVAKEIWVCDMSLVSQFLSPAQSLKTWQSLETKDKKTVTKWEGDIQSYKKHLKKEAWQSSRCCNMLQHVGDVQQRLECRTVPGHEEVQSMKAGGSSEWHDERMHFFSANICASILYAFLFVAWSSLQSIEASAAPARADCSKTW